MRFILFATCLQLLGCLGNRPGQQTGDAPGQSDTTAAAVLRDAGRSALDRATGLLTDYDYERERTVAVSDESGKPIMRFGHTTRFSGMPERRIADVRDSTVSGEGGAGLWEEYAGGATMEDTLEWGVRLLPEDPLVLGRQGIAYYRYADQGDTLVGGVSLRRIDAELRSGTSRSGIQSGRFYVDAGSGELVGFDLVFAHQSLLFDEQSRFRYVLQAAGDGRWLPLEVRVSSFLNLPLSKGQRFELRAHYSDPKPVAGS